MFQAGTDAVLADQLQRPAAPRPPPEPGVWTGFGTAVPKALAGAGLEVGAFASEVMGAFGQVLGAYPEAMGYNPTGEAKKQAEAARAKVLKAGVDYSTPQGDDLRTKARDIMPNPQTTGQAGMLLGGLAGFMGKAVGYGLTLGPAGPLALGGDLALTESDRLKGEGVDYATRAKAGAVAGAIGAGSMVVPMSGATAVIRAGKGVLVGEGSMIGQSLAEKAILKAAGYDKIADTFDPLDPWAIGMGLVPGALGAKFGGKAVKPVERAAGTKPLAEMGLGERQALRYDDTRLDAYAVQAAQREGIPPEVLLAIKNAGEKSGPAATSPAGAQGVMQFMPKTFKEFGQGDPMDPVNSIDAGARYLSKLHDAYGNWDAAVAHYNGGGVQAAIVRGGGVPTIPETAKYLARVKAYLGDTLDQHAAAAVKAEPDLVPAARVAQAAAALDASRLTADTDLAGRDAHVSAVVMAADQMGRGDRVEVAQHVQPGIDREANFKAWFDSRGVVDDEGAPLVVYHSGSPEFDGVKTGGRFGGVFVSKGGPVDYGSATYPLFLRNVLSIDELNTRIQESGDGGASIFSKLLRKTISDNDAEVIAAALTDGSHYPTGDHARGLLSAIDDSDAQVEIQKLRGSVARELGYGAVETPDETGGNTFMVVDSSAIKSAIGNSGLFDPRSASLTDPVHRLNAAVEELHAARQPPEAPRPAETAPMPTDEPASTAPRASGAETAPAQAAIDRAAAEVSRLNPDLLVQLDGMDSPMRVGDLLDSVKREAADDVQNGKLVEAAVACALRH